MKKKIEIARKGLVWALVCGMTASTFVGCKDYDDDINGLRTEIDGIKTGSIATMQKQLEGLLVAEQSLKGADEAIKASIAELEKTLKVHKEANDQLAALMGGKVDQVAYEGVVTALQEKDAAFAQQVADLLENKADNVAIQAVLTELAGRITALEGSAVTMAQVASEIAESEGKLSSQIASLKSGAIADLEDATESNLELINEIKTQLGVFEGTVSGLIDTKIDQALTQTMKDDLAKIADIEISVNKILGNYLEKTVFDKAEKALYAKVKVDSLALQGQINNITSLDNAQSLASKLAALNTKMYGDDTPEDRGVAGIAADALALAKANDEAISTLIKDALDENGAITEVISSAITTEMNKYIADGKTLSERLDNIFDRLSSLEGRVQSIAYVPEYNDGKVPHYFAGTNAGDLTLKFRVSPAKVAKDIKKEHISFFTKTLMTRSEGMTVNTVVVDPKEEGVIIVHVTPGSGLVYSTEITQNAVALKLNNAGANANLTTGYFIVEKVVLQNTDFKFEGITNYSYTNNEPHSLTETMKAQIKGRPVAELGFADGFVITKIGTYDVNDENKDDIDTYLETAGFALDMTAMTIQVRENKPGSIGKILKLTLKNEATGYTQEIDFKVDAAGTTKDYDYKGITTTSLDAASAAKTFVWGSQASNIEQVYTLKSDVLAGMIEGKTVAEIITALQNATATTYVMDDTEYEEAETTDAALSVAGGKVIVTLPASAVWKPYVMKTVFDLNDYGEIAITATLNLSYPTADFLIKQAALWSDNGYLLQYTPVSGTVLAITKDLTGAFKAVTGVVYSFEILATIDDDNDPTTPMVAPAGVTIVNDKTIEFSQKVDLSKLQIKAIAKVEGNATGKEVTFGIDMAYPVKIAFEPFVKDNKPVVLTYKAADIKAGTAYDWATDLQLKDLLNNDLMEDGTFKSGAFTTTYGLAGLEFTYTGNDGDLSADMFEVNATTGELTFTSTSLAKDVNVTVKVAATNTYGASESVYIIKLEKTN